MLITACQKVAIYVVTFYLNYRIWSIKKERGAEAAALLTEKRVASVLEFTCLNDKIGIMLNQRKKN